MGFTGFYRVLTGSSRVKPGFTGYYCVLLGFADFYRLFPGLIAFS